MTIKQVLKRLNDRARNGGNPNDYPHYLTVFEDGSGGIYTCQDKNLLRFSDEDSWKKTLRRIRSLIYKEQR